MFIVPKRSSARGHVCVCVSVCVFNIHRPSLNYLFGGDDEQRMLSKKKKRDEAGPWMKVTFERTCACVRVRVRARD